MRCEFREPTLDLDEALEVVRPVFDEMLEVFSDAGLSLRVDLYCAPWVHKDSPRHFAACRHDGRVVVVAPQIVDLDMDMVRAILAHELGHAADFTWPGRYALDARGRLTQTIGESVPRVLERWEARDTDEIERTADAIAEVATGRRIGYVGPCLLQAFDRGAARPQGLR